MLKAEQLNEMAAEAADRAVDYTEAGEFRTAEVVMTACAIYTVGAELIDRLDSIHFDVDGVIIPQTNNNNQIVALSIKPWLKRSKDDNSGEGADSNDKPQTTDPAASTEGD
jgi:hypothetical protein